MNSKNRLPRSKPEPFLPSEFDYHRDPSISKVPLTTQISLKGASYWFGTQLQVNEKIIWSAGKINDGAEAKRKARVK